MNSQMRCMGDPYVIHISNGNNGKDIESSNFWETEWASGGNIALSLNSRCVRMLIPDSKISVVEEYRTAKYAIMSIDYESARTEILFEDFTDCPYCFHTSSNAFLGFTPGREDSGREDLTLSVWGNGCVKLFECPLKFRRVSKIPYLKRWKESKTIAQPTGRSRSVMAKAKKKRRQEQRKQRRQQRGRKRRKR